MELISLPTGTIKTPNGLYSGLWALPRPTTHHWGSGVLLTRCEAIWGAVDIIFGKQDNVLGFSVDLDNKTKPSVCADWRRLPFRDYQFKSGYWDPPYLGSIGEDGDVHYSRMESCLNEILRVLSERLLILSPLIYPCPIGWKREAVIAVTMGPNKVIRALQSFVRIYQEYCIESFKLRDNYLLEGLPLFMSQDRL